MIQPIDIDVSQMGDGQALPGDGPGGVLPTGSVLEHLAQVRFGSAARRPAEVTRPLGLGSAGVAPPRTEPAPLDAVPTDPASATAGEPLRSPAQTIAALERTIHALTRQLARQTERAAAAEERVKVLAMRAEAERGAEQEAEREAKLMLGKRFGQQPHETFFAFVARLGMMAKAVPLGRSRPKRDSARPESNTDPDPKTPASDH
jgi:hypothetical protein